MTREHRTRPWLSFEVARVTIQFESAFLLGTGEGDGVHDAVFAADANGLPTLPGDSIAGVLRHAMAEGADPAEDELCRQVFGYQHRNEGDSSAVRISWAQVHNSEDKPVAFRGASCMDAVLELLAAGVMRDHVRIGPHGAVHGRGKFDELVVPAGARFTFEVVVDERSPRRASDLVGLLASRPMRIGRAGRRGLGRFRVVRARARTFDLRQEEDRRLYAKLPVALEDGDAGVLENMVVEAARTAPRWVHGVIRLAAVDTWLVGGAVPSGREPERKDKGWDRFPMTESSIVWTKETGGKERGKVVEGKEAPFLVPASGVKGALRHRTAFHARRLSQHWMGDREAEATQEECELFGKEKDSLRGRPGRLMIGDARVAVTTPYAALQHVSLDRFTQGPRDGLLFDELVLHGGAVDLDVDLRTDGLSRVARRAIAAALQDLCDERLSLGAGRAGGRFRGAVHWDDDGRWIQEEP